LWTSVSEPLEHAAAATAAAPGMATSASDAAAMRAAAVAASDVLRVIRVLVSVGDGVGSTESDRAEI
jgi:hypothetical protein